MSHSSTSPLVFPVANVAPSPSTDRPAVWSLREQARFAPVTTAPCDACRQVLLDKLRERGHPVSETSKTLAIVCGVARTPDGLLEANADHRKGGDVAGF